MPDRELQLRRRVKPLAIITKFLIIFMIVGVPILLSWITRSNFTPANLILPFGFQLGEILFFAGFLLILLWYIEVEIQGGDEVRELIGQLRFIMYNAKAAWSVGSGLIAIVVGLYLWVYLDDKTQPGDVFRVVSPIYLTVLGVSLGTHVLYKKTAPIIGTERLLEAIYDDLKSVYSSKKHPYVWLVYPALNIGFYRNRRAAWKEGVGFTDHSIFRKIETVIQAIITSTEILNVELYAVAYPHALYKELYTVYHNSHKATKEINDTNGQQVVDTCISSANRLLKLFDIRSNVFAKGDQETTLVSAEEKGEIFACEIHPNKFPQEVIIIGDVVYIIASYGLPMYTNGHFEPFPSTNLAYLISWRRHDPELAKTVRMFLKNYIQNYTID